MKIKDPELQDMVITMQLIQDLKQRVMFLIEMAESENLTDHEVRLFDSGMGLVCSLTNAIFENQ